MSLREERCPSCGSRGREEARGSVAAWVTRVVPAPLLLLRDLWASLWADPPEASTARVVPWGLREPILMWLVAELVPTLAILIDMGSSRVAGIEGRRFLTGGYELVYELVGDAATLVFAHLALRRLGADWRSFGFTSFDAGKAARSIAAGWIGMALAVRLLFGFLRVLLPGFDPEQPYIPEIDDALKVGAWEGVLALSSVLVAAPLTEEVLFRGFLFTALLRRGAGQAAVYSSLAFALLHFQPNAMVNAFVLGAVACALYWRLGSLWPAVAFHALCNLGAVSE